MRLEGKKALITGAGSGIGQALAAEAAERGVRVALTGRRKEPLEATLAELPGSGHIVLRADVTEPADRKALMAEIAACWGGLDLLVNNAGIVPVGPLGAASDEDLEAVLKTNLLAPMALVREALPLLKRSRRARVVNIGSVFGDIPYPLFAPYSATKAGLRGFSIALRRELAPLGIGVTYAAPRATRTPAARPMQSLTEPFEIKFDTPDAVAKFIWNAVAKEANAIYPAGPERMYVLMQRLFPRMVDKAIAKQFARVLAG
jgi:NAD(P)-dependent dehydrogenase (short-subunit alcohol dehydrogenase family)